MAKKALKPDGAVESFPDWQARIREAQMKRDEEAAKNELVAQRQQESSDRTSLANLRAVLKEVFGINKNQGEDEGGRVILDGVDIWLSNANYVQPRQARNGVPGEDFEYNFTLYLAKGENRASEVVTSNTWLALNTPQHERVLAEFADALDRAENSDSNRALAADEQAMAEPVDTRSDADRLMQQLVSYVVAHFNDTAPNANNGG